MSRTCGCRADLASAGRLAELAGMASAGVVVSAAADLVTAKEIVVALDGYPPKPRRHVLKQVGLADVRTVKNSTAEAVLRLLRGGDPQRHARVTELLGVPSSHAFANLDGLRPEDLVRLLDPASDKAGKMPGTPVLSAFLNGEGPSNLLRWRLARVVQQDLAADPEAFLQVDKIAEQARERLPSGWRLLVNAALNQRLTIAAPQPAPAEPEPVPPEVPEVEPVEPDDLADPGLRPVGGCYWFPSFVTGSAWG